MAAKKVVLGAVVLIQRGKRHIERGNILSIGFQYCFQSAVAFFVWYCCSDSLFLSKPPQQQDQRELLGWVLQITLSVY